MSTRFRIITTSLIIAGMFLFGSLLLPNIAQVAGYEAGLLALIVSAVTIPLTAWVVEFKLKGERLFTILTFPSVSVGIVSAFMDIIIDTSVSDLDRFSSLIGSTMILFVVSYLLIANINILNLASIKTVPLGQAARAAHYVMTMIFSYFAFVLIVSLNVNILVKALLVFAQVFAYSFIALWTIALAYNQRLLSALGISILMLFGYLVFALWPLESFYYALFMTLFFYMALGVALEIREIIGKWLWFEYAAIFIVMLVILLVTASWGVNGTIL